MFHSSSIEICRAQVTKLYADIYQSKREPGSQPDLQIFPIQAILKES